MSDNNQDTRKPEEIESDIEEHRERLDRTLHELEEKISPQRWMDSTLDYVRNGGANEFASNLSDTIKNNPVPFVLTSVGLGWLILSQRNANKYPQRYDDDDDVYGYEDGKHYPRTTRTAPTSVPPSDSTRVPPTTSVPSSAGVPPATGTTAPTTTRVPPAAHTTTTLGEADHDEHQSKGRMSGAKEKAQHMSSNVKGRAQGMSNSVKGRAQSMSDSMRDGTARMKSGSRSAMHGASYRAQNAGQQTTQFIQEHPLVSAALGVAIGAAIGSLLPSTRTEDERLGGLRDKAVNRAAEEGQKHADKAQAKVHDKAEQAKQDAPAGADSQGANTQHASRTSGSSGSNTGSSTPGSSTTSGASGSSSHTSTAGTPGVGTGNSSTSSPSSPSRPAEQDISRTDINSGKPPSRGG